MYIGVDIGGSKILVAASDDGKRIVRQQKIETPDDGNQGVAELIQLIEQVAGEDAITAIAVASAGPLDLKAGRVLPPAPNMHGWRDVEIVGPIQNHFKVPTILEVDSVAAALAESEIGAGRGYPYVLYVTISTGIGTGLIIDGEPYRGATGLEGGHIILDPDGPPCGCGGRGHFESMCSGLAIKRDYGKYGYQITDPATWDEIAAKMALGLHSLALAYAPSVVVIGGGVGVHYDQFGHFLDKHLKTLTPMFKLPPMVQAEYTETAVVYGALILAARSR